jgi:hypothetical protein
MNDYYKSYPGMLWLPFDSLLYWQAILTNWPLCLASYLILEKAGMQLVPYVE